MVQTLKTERHHILGTPIRSTFDNQNTQKYASVVSILTSKASDLIRNTDLSASLRFLRVRTTRYEILISPDKEYNLMVIQDCSTLHHDD